MPRPKEEAIVPLSDEQKALVESHLVLAKRIATAFHARIGTRWKISLGDLTSIAMLGLCHAAQGYDPSTGNAFDQYASATIWRQIGIYLRDEQPLMPRTHYERFKHLGPGSSAEEIAAVLNKINQKTPPQRVRLQRTLRLCIQGKLLPLSIDAPVEDAHPITNLLASNEPGTDQQAIDHLLSPTDFENERLQKAIDHLSDRERHVLYQAELEGKTQQTIAREIGSSQMTVSRCYTKTLHKIREYMGVPEPLTPSPRRTCKTILQKGKSSSHASSVLQSRDDEVKSID